MIKINKTYFNSFLVLLMTYKFMKEGKETKKKNIVKYIEEKKYLKLTESEIKPYENRGDEPTWVHIRIQCSIKGLRDDGSLEEVDKNSTSDYIITQRGYIYLLKNSEILIDKKEELKELGATEMLNNEILNIEIVSKRYSKISKLYNRLVMGAPGTGKSHLLEEDAKILCANRREYYKKITFYPDYTYGQFIGSYKPTTIYSKEIKEPLYDSTGKEQNDLMKPYIDYKVVQGPFLEILCNAINDKNNNYVIIIDEINRGNAQAIFGNIFQLLERDTDKANKGNSKYSITLNKELMDYIIKETGNQEIKKFRQIYIPKNLYIWATMNSADQNVEPLDSAFKRRWTPEYISINDNENLIDDYYISMPFIRNLKDKHTNEDIWGNTPQNERKVKWNLIRKEINRILKTEWNTIREDKLLGPFLLTKEELENEETIKSKLIIYLKEDILKNNSNKLFNEPNSISDLLESYDSGKNIFKIPDENFIKIIEKELENRNKNGD